MNDDGAFNPAARACIYEAAMHRCVGCGRPDLTCQHRRPRGMGGTSGQAALAIGHPANGVALCGSGTTGCHGWAERHPRQAMLLGWRLEHGQHPLVAPWWTRFGWKRWVEEDDGFVSVAYVDPDELDQRRERDAAVIEAQTWRAGLQARRHAATHALHPAAR